MLVQPNGFICTYPPFIFFFVFLLVNLGLWGYFISKAIYSCSAHKNDCEMYTFASIGHSVFVLFVSLALCMIIRQYCKLRELARQRQANPNLDNAQMIYGTDGNIDPYRYNPVNAAIDYQTNPQGYDNPNPYYNPNQNQPYPNNYSPPKFYAND